MKRFFYQLVEEALRDERWGGLALVVFDLVRVRGVAVVADDVFQVIGLD